MHNKKDIRRCSLSHAIERHPDSYFIRLKKNHRYQMRISDEVYLLKSGSVSIFRKEDNVLIMNVSSPAVMGLSFIHPLKQSFYFRCCEDSELSVVNFKSILAVIEHKNLWKNVYQNITGLLLHYIERDFITTQKKTHRVVEEHLKIIWAMDEEIREKTSIYKFILDRNIISRSAIHKVISTMQAQNLVNVRYGRLVYFKGVTNDNDFII
ncbi:helix-turn-helix domain-containing protein [Salmonella enterica]|nr:helix-turn-helix domain-containing protein [Salmonella enterica]